VRKLRKLLKISGKTGAWTMGKILKLSTQLGTPASTKNFQRTTASLKVRIRFQKLTKQ
jgi:hypothetical protein